LFGGSSHNLLGSFGHGVGADDGQAGIGEQLLAQFFIGALHAHNQRHVQVHCLASCDHAFGDDVATHDSAEDIDENGFYPFVAKHDLESFGDFLGRSTAADVQEVGRLAAEQFDGVHGGHSQAGDIHQAADIAVELDVGQTKLASFDFDGVLQVKIAILDDFGLMVQGVGIKVELGVQSNDIAVAVTVQRVDFYQGGVGIHVALIELLENI